MEHFKLIITIVDRGKGGKAVDLYRKHHLHFDFACLGVASDGCVEVMPERVIVLAATIERAEDIDRNRALAAKHRAEERLRQKQSQHEYIQTQAALARALARLKPKPGK